MIDLKSEYGRRVDRRLKDETIIWLVTAGRNGTPQPRPVWFLWDGETFLIYSRPGTAKLRHIEANPAVALNLDGDGSGGDIVVIIGRAMILEASPPAERVQAYFNKYGSGLERINMTPVQFAQTYTEAIEIKPQELRGH